MGHSFDMLTFDFLLKPPQPVTGLFLKLFLCFEEYFFLQENWEYLNIEVHTLIGGRGEQQRNLGHLFCPEILVLVITKEYN